MTSAPNRVLLLGVRHHGPGSARSVVAELDRVKPAVVLIEGPADADPLLALAAAPGMSPPVALLGYAPDEPRVSAFWPFAEFSPFTITKSTPRSSLNFGIESMTARRPGSPMTSPRKRIFNMDEGCDESAR